MTVRPIIFSAPMILALLAGRKTQTRRLATSRLAKCRPGDLLYVRESFAHVGSLDPGLLVFKADYPTCVPGQYENVPANIKDAGYRWRPSIHMPRSASRLTLEVTSTRIEPLVDLSWNDALAEGIEALSKDGGRTFKYGIPDRDGLPGTDDFGWPWSDWDLTPQLAFARLWTKLHGPNAWAERPDVFALTFIVHQLNVDELLRHREAA